MVANWPLVDFVRTWKYNAGSAELVSMNRVWGTICAQVQGHGDFTVSPPVSPRWVAETAEQRVPELWYLKKWHLRECPVLCAGGRWVPGGDLTRSTAWERAASSAQSRDTGIKCCTLINQVASDHVWDTEGFFFLCSDSKLWGVPSVKKKWADCVTQGAMSVSREGKMSCTSHLGNYSSSCLL